MLRLLLLDEVARGHVQACAEQECIVVLIEINLWPKELKLRFIEQGLTAVSAISLALAGPKWYGTD